jgi:hypothetical protein
LRKRSYSKHYTITTLEPVATVKVTLVLTVIGPAAIALLPVIVKLADSVVAFCTNGLVEGKVTDVAAGAAAQVGALAPFDVNTCPAVPAAVIAYAVPVP